jgi:hypothetical protein
MKDEKILLMAAESRDQKEIIAATRKVVQNCIDYADPNQGLKPVGQWPIFDVNYLYVLCRARSVNPIVPVELTCKHNDCNTVMTVEIKIDDVKVTNDNDPDWLSNQYELGDGMKVIMKYPTYNAIENIKPDATEEEVSISIMADSIDTVMTGDGKRYNYKDVVRTELVNFVESMQPHQFGGLRVAFIDKLPVFKVEKEHACTKCGFVHKMEFSDLTSFF